MADVGSAYVTLMPSMRGFSTKVNSQLAAMDTSAGGIAMGKRTASGFAGGMASGGIIIGAASAVMTKAMDAVSSSVGRAVSRVDTMANFPKVMVNLGYSADDAARNIQTMSDGLEGLPTSLDAMVGMVQQLTPLSKNMDEATQIGLSFNNMLLAGGASTQQQQSALLQYTQALAKGKPELQDWRTLQQVMPGQLDQVAKSLLGTSKGSMDLYEALKEDKVSMNDFNQAILRLNTEGANGFASFEQQAKDATQGIQTAMDNAATRTAKGVATIIDSIGQENISGAINYLSSGIGGVAKEIGNDFKGATEFVMSFSGEIKGVVDWCYKVAPAVIKVSGALLTLKAAKGIISGISGIATNSAAKYSAMGEDIFYYGVQMEQSGKRGAKGIQSIGNAMSKLTPGKMLGIGAAVGVATIAVSAGVELWQQYKTRTDNVTKSTSGLKDEINKTRNAIQSTSGVVNTLSDSTKVASFNADEFFENQAQHVATIAELRTGLEGQLVTYNSAESAIKKYVNTADLNTAQQGELKAAINLVNQEFGTNYKVIDAVNGVISDSAGNYNEAKSAAGEYKDAIVDLIETKKLEAQQNVLTKEYEEAYKAQRDAEKAYGSALKEFNDYKAAHPMAGQSEYGSLIENTEYSRLEANVRDAKNSMVDATDAADGLAQELGMVGEKAAGVSKGIAEEFTGTPFESYFNSSVSTFAEFSARADELGISVKALGSLSDEELHTMATGFDGSAASIVTSLAAINGGIDAYNAKQLNEKRANAQIDDSQLIDAQGNIYTWNGTNLVDKDGNVCVNGKQLVDAQGRLITWNNWKMKDVSASVSVNGAASLDDLISRWNNWNPGTKELKASVSGAADAWSQRQSKSGKHATGGFIKTYSTGGFLTGGITNLGIDRQGVMHIAGEAGTEWIMGHADGTTSIVPVENKKYLEPYASTIASMITPSSSMTTTNITIHVTADSATDGHKVGQQIARVIKLSGAMKG